MNHASSPLPGSDAADTRAEEVSRHRHVLNAMIDAGAELMQIMLQQARARHAADADGPAPVAGPAVAEDYDRVSRSVRRSIMLVQRLSEPAADQSAKHDAEQRAARRQIIRAVEDEIEAKSSGDEAESLVAELHERLDGPELDDEIGVRPVAEIINDVRRDLGLAYAGLAPYKRRTPADVAELCARAARAGAGEIARMSERARTDARRGWSEAGIARAEGHTAEALLLGEAGLDEVVAALRQAPPRPGLASRPPRVADDG